MPNRIANLITSVMVLYMVIGVVCAGTRWFAVQEALLEAQHLEAWALHASITADSHADMLSYAELAMSIGTARNVIQRRLPRDCVIIMGKWPILLITGRFAPRRPVPPPGPSIAI